MIDPDEVRQAMRQWTSGVTIVASSFENEIHGMTVNSFTSVSLEPPVIIVSLQKPSRTHLLVSSSLVFGVTLLASSQKEIAARFAGKIPDESNRFTHLETFTITTGSPFIVGGLSFFDCKVFNSVDVGAQTVFFGEIVGIKINQTGAPLIYHDRHYQLLKNDDQLET